MQSIIEKDWVEVRQLNVHIRHIVRWLALDNPLGTVSELHRPRRRLSWYRHVKAACLVDHVDGTRISSYRAADVAGNYIPWVDRNVVDIDAVSLPPFKPRSECGIRSSRLAFDDKVDTGLKNVLSGR